MLFVLFALLWVFDLVVATIAPHLIPYRGLFSHPTTLNQYSFPHAITSLANFDGIFYIRIAHQGYSQFEQAFFPLYPLLMRFISPIFGNNLLVTGLVLSNACFLTALVVFKKYLSLIFGKKHFLSWVLPFLIAFPTSFFFHSVYTEGLFLLLTISSLFFLKKKRYFWASLFAALASATRLAGILLIIPFAVELFFSRRQRLLLHAQYSILVAPFIGLFAYMMYLAKTTGNALMFLTSQPAFGASRQITPVFLPQVLFRYVKILTTVKPGIGYTVAGLEIFTFCFVFFLVVWHIWKLAKGGVIGQETALLGVALFSLANLLLPTATGTLGSVPRYALLSLSAPIALAQIKNKPVKIAIILLFVVLHAILFGLFTQGYFVS